MKIINIFVNGAVLAAFGSFSVGAVGAAPALTKQAVSAVVASASTGSFVATNTTDGNLKTRWAGKGDGVSIQYDLGAAHDVSQLKLAWFNGVKRTYKFEVQLSTDGTKWKTVFSGASKPSDELQAVDFAAANARYVRIVGHGSSVDAYLNLAETEIWAKAA